MPYLLQSFVEKKINTLIQSGYLRKHRMYKRCALYARKLNDSCIETRPHTPNMEELQNHLSTEITRVQNEPLRISKIDLEKAYVQTKLSEKTSRECNFSKTEEK